MRRSRPRRNKPTRREAAVGATVAEAATTEVAVAEIGVARIGMAGAVSTDASVGGDAVEAAPKVGDRGSDQEGPKKMTGDKGSDRPSQADAVPGTVPADAAAEGDTPPVERVIERFGGIRPMAAKLDVPVTTVQGWKKRGSIPPPRHDDLRAAAARHGLVIDEEELTLAGQHEAGQPDSGSSDAGRPDAPGDAGAVSDREEGRFGEGAGAVVGGPSAETGAAPDVAPVDSAGKVDEPGAPAASELLAPDTGPGRDASSSGSSWAWEPPSGAAAADTAEPSREPSRGGSVWTAAVSVVALAVAAAALSQPYWGDAAPAAPAAPAAMGRSATPAVPPVDETARAAVEALKGKVEALGAALSGFSGAGSSGTGSSGTGGSDPRIADLSAGMAALKGDVARMGETLAALGSDRVATPATTGSDPAIAEALARLAKRLDAMEASVDAKVAAVAAVAVDAVKTEGAAVESASTGPALALAVGQLRAALAGGGAFADQLDMARALAGGNPAMTEPLVALAPLAASGAPTAANLSRRFSALAGDIVRAEGSVIEGDWLSEVLGTLRGLVMVRPRGADVTGDGAAAVVARAEAALAAGRTADAVTELKALTGPAAAVAAPWLKDAEARVIADRAGEALNRAAVALLTGAGAVSNGATEGAR